MVIAFMNLTLYYQSEKWPINLTILNFVFFLLAYPVNHVFYKIDHAKSNRFMGRYLQGGLFVFSLYAILQVKAYWEKSTISSPDVSLIFGIALLLFLLEAAFTVVVKLFRASGWHAW
jgi:hypothetical protein